ACVGGLLVTLKIAVPSSTSSNIATYAMSMPISDAVLNCRQKNCPPRRGMVAPADCWPFRFVQPKPGYITGRYSIPAAFASAMSGFQLPVAACFWPSNLVILPTFHGLITSKRRKTFAHWAFFSFLQDH